MRQDLSIYLLRKKTLPSAISAMAPRLAAQNYVEAPPLSGKKPDFRCACYIQKSSPSPPSWADFLAPHFSFSPASPMSQSAASIILVGAKRRTFAVTFGHARHALSDDLIEPDFGLRVALNEVEPNSLRHLSTKTLDWKTKERSTYHHAGGTAPEFALDLDVEWLRRASGKAVGDKSFRAVAGSECVRLFGYREPLTKLHSTCIALGTSYDQGLPSAFAFAGQVERVDPKLSRTLNSRLDKKLAAFDLSGTTLIVPRDVYENAVHARIRHGQHKIELDDLDDVALGEALVRLRQQLGKNALRPKALRLEVEDSSRNRLLESLLRKHLNTELSVKRRTHLLVEGTWIRVTSEYEKRIRALAKDLETSLAISLPTWDHSVLPPPKGGSTNKERVYNLHVAKSDKKNWLFQDGKLISNVEPADLIHRSRHLVHVKHGTSSAALSHAFGQTAGAAALLAREATFRKELERRYRDHFKEELFGTQPTVVTAIGRKKGADTFGRMLLARISAVEHARRVRALGFSYAVLRFDVVP